MKLYRIYIEDKNREDIERVVSSYFDSFTIYNATGYWKGNKEASLVIEIMQFLPETWLTRKVYQTAKAIKIMNEQECVLVTCDETITGDAI